jgi:single-strand DNA-binding protein
MYQSFTVIGRLGRDPEMRYMPSGDPVTSFSLATDRQYNNKSGEKVKETTWVRVSVFGRMAETVNQYLHKGSLVLAEGRLTPDPKTGGPKLYTKQDGSVGASFELVANTVRFLNTKSEEAASSEPSSDHEEDISIQSVKSNNHGTPEDAIPF